MKAKRSDILTCVLFCAFVFGMLALYLLLPPNTFSEKEKRELSPAPTVTADTVLSGQFGETVETYLADHIPGRDFFVGLASYYDLLTGRQYTKDVYPAAGDRIVEAPQSWNEAAAQRNMNAINKFSQTTGKNIDLMIVPSAGFILENTIQGIHDPYTDDQIISDIYAMAGENVRCLDLTKDFLSAENPGDLYYRTDHHWTSLGAYRAYQVYMESLGRTCVDKSDFKVETFGDFLGSTYSRSGLWLTPGENVELWKTDTRFTVTNGESDKTSNSLFYPERLEELDKYTVYLDGNHSLVRIENPEAKGSGKLLVIRDSYANCLGTFLAHSYETEVLVDLRYYKKPISELLAAEEFTDVLVCYSIGNFLTDTNMIFLR